MVGLDLEQIKIWSCFFFQVLHLKLITFNLANPTFGFQDLELGTH
jgi:hypothetical protein